MSVNDASRIVIDDFIVMLQIVVSLTDDSGGIIYYRNMFKVDATDELQFFSIEATSIFSTFSIDFIQHVGLTKKAQVLLLLMSI